MANHEIPQEPIFSEELRKLETTDPGHANTFNPLFEILIKNDVHLKRLAEGLKAGTVENPNLNTENKDYTGAINEILDIQSANADAISTLGDIVTSHQADDVKHVTQVEKDTWNNKAEGIHNHSGVYEPVFSKNTAFNKNFGTTSGTVCQGNDSRLSDSRKCNNTFDNASTARSNLGLTGTSNTTHYHDSRYAQTRIYNGSLQYYDGSWKYASDAIYMLSNTIRETQCTTPLTFTQNNRKLAGKFTAKCNGVLRISAELAGASSTKRAYLTIHKYTDSSVLPVEAPIGTIYNPYNHVENYMTGDVYTEVSIDIHITAGDVAFIGFGAQYNGDYSSIRNIKIRYDISNAS